MKISNILKSNNLKQIATIFFNLGSERNETNENFRLLVTYRKSKYSKLNLDEQIINLNNELMKEYTNLDFEVSGASTHQVIILNDLNINRKVFLEKLYSKIQRLRFDYTVDQFKEIIIASIFAFRGSQDFTRGYYSVDILRDNISDQYIKDLTSILFSLDDSNQLNMNFRELQPEYLEGKERNPQLRINLRWFYDKYGYQVYNINRYKYDILKSNENLISRIKLSSGLTREFMERILFYQENIIERKSFMNKLSSIALKQEVENLRSDLEFDYENIERSDYTRNTTIVNIANATLPDECVSCKNQYLIKDRSFYLKDSSRYYLEIHHVISFGSDRSGDVLENLVKLCPTCHRALTPNRANESYQKGIISNILDNSDVARDYVKNFVSNPESKDDLVEFVYEKLK